MLSKKTKARIQDNQIKREAQTRVAAMVATVDAPSGTLELMSFGLIPKPELKVDPGKSPPMPSEVNGVQPLQPESIKLSEADSQQLHEMLENPPAPNQKLKDAMVRFREGVKDDTIKTITIDSYSDFKDSDAQSQ